MNQQLTWKQINHQDIYSGYFIDPFGNVKHENMTNDENPIIPDYHSSNGYDFILLINKDEKPQLFPIDDLLALAFIPIPDSLRDKRIKVNHINGNTHDNDLSNLEWVEDIEEWRVCTYPGVKPGMYEVSSWGRIRNIKNGRIRILGDNSRGYLGVKICDKQFKIHRLVAYQFLRTDARYLKTVNHINGDKRKNYLKTLRLLRIVIISNMHIY